MLQTHDFSQRKSALSFLRGGSPMDSVSPARSAPHVSKRKRNRESLDTRNALFDFEHSGGARENAWALGFDDLPGSRSDCMSDLNMPSRGDSVDSLSGGDSVSTAEEITEYDNITDSNTLLSAATIGGVHGASGTPHSRRRQRFQSEFSTHDGAERDRISSTLETDAFFEVRLGRLKNNKNKS
jgi:hypothetical protein